MTQHKKVRRLPLQIFVIIFGILLIGQFIFVQAQTRNTSPERGFSPGKSYAFSDIENIGLYSGNLMLNVPLGSLPAGRGGMSGGINLRYDSKLWDVWADDPVVHFTTPWDRNTLLPSPDGGWQYGYKYGLKLEYRKLGFDEGYCTSGNNNDGFFPYKLKLVMPDGSQHELTLAHSAYVGSEGFMGMFPDGRLACTNDPLTEPLTGTITYYTTDNTFLRLELTSDGDSDWENNTWTLYSPDGTRVIHNPASGISQRIKDRNDNYIDIIENTTDSNYSNHRTTYLKDQLERKVVIEYSAATDEDWVRSEGFNGEDVITRVKWKDITVNKTYFACQYAPSPLAQDAWRNFPLNQDFRVVEKIYLPEQVGDPEDADDFYYTFDYNVNSTSATDVGWGEVNKVILPSDADGAGTYATYSYTYDNVSGWNTSTNLIDAEHVIYNRPVQKQLHYNKEYDGASVAETETWTYATTPTVVSSLANLTAITTTAPDGGVSKEHYAQIDSTFTSPAIPEYVQGESYKSEAADGTVLERVYKTNIPGAGHNSYKANRYVKYEFVSPKDASGNYTKTAIREFSQDKNGNVTEIKEYDYVTYSTVPRNSVGIANGLPSGATPTRITKPEYYNDTPDASSSTYTDTESYHLTSSPRIRNAVKSSEVQNGSGTPKSRSEMTYDDAATTGNLTQTKVWDSFKNSATQAYSNPLTSTNSISTSVAYNSYGGPTLTTDGKGNQVQITYDSTYTLFPVQTVSAYGTAIARTTTATFDFCTGLIKTMTDADNSVTNATEYDDLGRPTKVAAAVGTASEIWTQTVYGDANRRITVKSDLEVKGDGKKISIQHFDQLGRVRLSRMIENFATENPAVEADGIKVQTRYLTSGSYNYQLSSNPYRAATSGDASSEPSMGWTRSKTINTGKHSETETFSGSSLPAPWGSSSNSTGIITTDIDLDRTLVTDQAGKQKINRTNAFGQLTDIWEIKASDGATVSVTFPNQSGIAYGYQTSYIYDTLSNLTTVTQGSSQTRTFTYSSLSRLLSATNPESGTINYQYDANGNLMRKTDARSLTTDYTYDALNRITFRNYSDSTPDVTYTFDNLTNAKGKLTKISSSISTTEYLSFDIMGRVLGHKQTTDGKPYTTAYKYNLSGALLEETYPSTRVVKNVLDNDGKLSRVQGKKTANTPFWDYARNFTYTAARTVSSMELGNTRWESTQSNSRLQPTQIALGSAQTTTDKLKLDYSYGTTANNGDVLSQTITVPTAGSYTGFTATQSYTYDSLNRIKDAAELISSTQTWKQTFLYDRYGNKNFDTSNNNTTTLGNCPTAECNPTISTTNNRFTSGQNYTYDASGNLTHDARDYQFSYDEDNNQVEVKNKEDYTLGTYFYDGDGKQVMKITYQDNEPVETTIFIYDAPGKLIAEHSDQLSQTPQVSYLTTDNLGTPRINTDKNGTVTARHDYRPFGEEISTSQRISGLGYNSDEIRKKFTGYERDSQTDLDFAQARMYNRIHGRFTSADPTLVSMSGNNPQSFNRYIYVMNNPLLYTDPLGLWAIRIIKRDKIGEDGKPMLDKKGRNIKESVVMVVKTKPTDDAVRLAKQLGLKKEDAEKLVSQVGTKTEVRLSELEGRVGRVFSFIEGRLDNQFKWEREHSNEIEKLAKEGKHGPSDNNCSGTTAFLGLGINEPDMGPNQLDEKVGNPLLATVVKDGFQFLDMMRYEKNGEATHWVNFIFEDDDGTPRVFTKSGNEGQYNIQPAKELEGGIYGTLNGTFRGRRNGF